MNTLTQLYLRMKNNVILLSIIAFLLFNQVLAQKGIIEPIERKVGKLNISIDPRMELLSTVQLLSDYFVVNRNLNYSKEVLDYFKDFSELEAVKITNKLYEEYSLQKVEYWKQVDMNFRDAK